MDRMSVENVLSQIRAMQEMAAGRAPTQAPQAAESSGFSAALKAQIDQVNGVQVGAEQLAKSFESGTADVSLQDVMIAMQKANISFQTMVQVRNRLVAAYQDVMNMQI